MKLCQTICIRYILIFKVLLNSKNVKIFYFFIKNYNFFDFFKHFFDFFKNFLQYFLKCFKIVHLISIVFI